MEFGSDMRVVLGLVQDQTGLIFCSDVFKEICNLVSRLSTLVWVGGVGLLVMLTPCSQKEEQQGSLQNSGKVPAKRA